MGKNLIQQRRGKGTPVYRSPGHRFLGAVKYKEGVKGVIIDIVDAPGRTAPLASVDFSGTKDYVIASKGMEVGNQFYVRKVKDVPEGSKIYNIELMPGDGGKLCRTSGSFAILVSAGEKKSTILLPSKKKKVISSDCRVSIGSVAGSGRKEKPFMKAGRNFYAKRSLGKLYPRVSGVSMNPVDHPFGGSAKPGKHKTVSRHAPPGRKVGSIAAKRMGKKKR
ncbi:MAG: 50S ribosomal protein L2 [Candidatus Aenigmarchaeota archaeon]|nr:50S ribosomal protein L2 [Candidatus Aenigmarchaeota archaeon]